MLTVIAPTNKSSVCAENAVEDLWKMSGRVDALHDFIARKIAESRKSSYRTETPLIELNQVCAIIGFDDLIDIQKNENAAGGTATNS